MEENRELSFMDYVFLFYILLDIIFFYILTVNDVFPILQMLCIFTLFVTLFLVIPVRYYWKEDLINSRFIRSLILCKIGLITTISVTFYRIFISHNYNLSYSYYIGYASFTTLMLINLLEDEIREYRNKKKKEKRNTRLKLIGKFFLNLFFILFYVGIPVFTITRFYLNPHKQIVIYDLAVPDSIYLTPITGNTKDMFDSDINITSPTDIRMIIHDLNQTKAERLNISGILNTERREDDNPYYSMYIENFTYQDENKQLHRANYARLNFVENQYITFQLINDLSKFDLFIKPLPIIFRLNLSEETMEMLSGYLK